jgi:hypothetical protein
MILAFLLGGVGFAVRIFWVPALVVMAVVFGLILADRRAARGGKGVVPEIVANVVNEAREIYQAAAGTSEEEEGEKRPRRALTNPRTNQATRVLPRHMTMQLISTR